MQKIHRNFTSVWLQPAAKWPILKLRTNRKVWITMTYRDIKHNAEVNELLKKGNQNLGLLGFTDHS